MIDQLYRISRRTRITWRLLGTVLVLLVVGLAVSVVQWLVTQRHMGYLQQLETVRLPVDQRVQQAALDIASSQVMLIEYVADREPDYIALDEHIISARNALTEAMLITTDPERLQRLRELHEQAERYSNSVERLQFAKLGGNRPGVVYYSAEVQRLGDNLRDEAQRLVRDSAAQAREDAHREAQAFQQSALTGSLVLLLTFAVLATAAFLIARSVIQPIREIQQATQRMARGEEGQPLPDLAQAPDELGELARSFNEMARTIQQAQAEQAAWSRQLEERVQQRTRELGQMVKQQEQLLATVRALSVPVIPILERIIVMPLVGVVDSQRAAQVMDSLLEGIEAHRAQVALVDITGVPVVDTHVAGTLLQVAQAARLLGCQVVLVGIRPEVAHTLVTLGVDLRQWAGMVTRANLQSGVEYALRATGRSL